MHTAQPLFMAMDADDAQTPFAELEQRPASIGTASDAVPSITPFVSPPSAPFAGPVVARLHGFDLLEQPLVGGLSALPGQVLPARATVPLRHAMVGREVVVWFENGDARAPIIMGVVELHPLSDVPAQPGVSVMADGERHVIEAEREIVLRCGDASITLTRAGKVIIKGSYILSRSSGYNKIKGAAIDIN